MSMRMDMLCYEHLLVHILHLLPAKIQFWSKTVTTRREGFKGRGSIQPLTLFFYKKKSAPTFFQIASFSWWILLKFSERSRTVLSYRFPRYFFTYHDPAPPPAKIRPFSSQNHQYATQFANWSPYTQLMPTNNRYHCIFVWYGPKISKQNIFRQ